MAKPEQVVYDGLAQVAHAIRRSTALYVAMSILPPDSTVDDLKEQADDLAQWIRGKAAEPEGEDQSSRPSLGIPWHERD